MSMRLITRLFATGAIALFTNQIHAQPTQPYEPVSRAWIEAGVLFQDSTDLSGFPGSLGDSNLEFDPGFRAGLGSGYAFTPYFSLDWEVAVLASSVKDASGLDEMDATITQVPFLVSGTLQYQNQTAFTPFVSIGAGAAATAINIDEARLGATTLDGSDYAFVFAWQLAGGLRYALNDRLGLGLLYKYLWTADAEWNDPDLELDGLRSHAVLAFLSYRF